MANYFVYQFVPHRPDFPADLTETETAVMQEHFGYWQTQADKGVAVVYGPVGDPAGTWGLAVVEADSEEEVAAIRGGDPVIKSDLGRVNIYPMLNTIIRS
ncbi:MAG TPA: YciI family protein [Mycobacterium sp.]|nr:YciI family protein [Mycobacterium sp.]